MNKTIVFTLVFQISLSPLACEAAPVGDPLGEAGVKTVRSSIPVPIPTEANT